MKRIPLLLSPVGKDYLWGGSRLNDDFSFECPVSPFAEAWVCATHPEGSSRVSALSCTLSELLAMHPGLLGTHALRITEGVPTLPILIKLIDAKQDLSVQVHPDDAYALAHEGEPGKTEMWYVLDARPGTELIYGLKIDMTAETFRRRVAEGRIGEVLNHVPVHKNDVYMVNPGTVHAIGAGALVAEIQQNSNITYRLYDYDRVGKDGRKRTLHIDKALEVADLRSSSSPRQPMRLLRYRAGCAFELLMRCRYFQVERLLLNTETCRKLVAFKTQENSFHALLCVDGCGSIVWEGGGINFFKGDCVFIPAESVPLLLHGKAQLLNVSC